MIPWFGRLGWAQLGGFSAEAGWAHACIWGQLLVGQAALSLEVKAGLWLEQWM